jgi:predicted RNA binding protein YcfA (HicA-like mRNA interferase family)
MSQLPDVFGAEVVEALRKARFCWLQQKGSHISMEKIDATGQWRTIVPKHRELARRSKDAPFC